jgi:hypothetical protein
VSVETFANVSALEWLELSYNNVRSVDINTLRSLPKLPALYLEGNPLQCDCQLQEVWGWCQDHNIQTAYEKEVPECDTLSEVQCVLWGVLEKAQCLQDNIYYYGDYKNTSYGYNPIDDTDTHTDTETVTDTDTEIEQGGYVPSFLKQYEVPVYAVFYIFGTTGNVIILIIIICNKNTRNVPYIFNLNLYISDMICLTVLFFESCARRISDVRIIKCNSNFLKILLKRNLRPIYLLRTKSLFFAGFSH